MQKLDHNKIELIIYDFDGVMTDNQVLVLQDGTEGVVCSRADGLAVEKIMKAGVKQMIVSSETNPVVKARAQKLKIPCIFGIGIKTKKTIVEKYCEDHSINLKKVLYIGNDINDLKIMKIVGIPIAPADAVKEIKKIAKIITLTPGGKGVIRELLNIFNLS